MELLLVKLASVLSPTQGETGISEKSFAARREIDAWDELSQRRGGAAPVTGWHRVHIIPANVVEAR